MTLRQRIESVRVRLHRRIRWRNRANRRHNWPWAHRDAAAVRTLRARLRALIDRAHRHYPRVMFDDTSVSLIPKWAHAVAGYVNGIYVTIPALRSIFGGHARIVTIAVNASVVADALDVESGDATNADCPGWFRRFKAERPHEKPIFYTSVSNADALVATLAAAGIARHQYILWTAHYGVGKHVCGPHTCGDTEWDADSTQWTSSSHERSLDESVCRRSFWERRLA